MTKQAEFTLKGRNPDILTSIANLSNDEVFTPPEFANRMLDTLAEAWAASNSGASIWADKTVTFLDPFTKSGVFLREITRRLVDGLAGQIPDLQTRVNHVLTKQVFGIAITELTALLARRSVYCSKWANGEHSICTEFETESGNIWFERTEHAWVGGPTRELRTDAQGNTREVVVDGKCKYCGANQRDYDRGLSSETHAYGFIHTDSPQDFLTQALGPNMKFDVIIGNPPYQLSDGGNAASASPIYQLFVEQAKSLEPRFMSFVIPARWYSGGKGLADFRQVMLQESSLRALHDFPSTSEVFPGVNVRGGICYFLWDRDFVGECEVSTHNLGEITSKEVRPLLEPGLDSFIRFNEGVGILRKVRSKNGASGDSFSSLVSARKPFGFDTQFRGHEKQVDSDCRLFFNGGKGWVSRNQVKIGQDLIDEFKLLVPYASPGSDDYPHLVLSKPIVAVPGTVSSETYLVVGPFQDEKTARHVAQYMSTVFFRFMVNLMRASQHVTRNVYGLVPLQAFDRSWNDAELASHYGLTKAEQDFMALYVKPVAWGEDFS